MRIVLRSGTQLDIPVGEYTVQQSKITGECTGIQWTHGEGVRLSYVHAGEVVAVVRIDEPTDGAS